MNKENKKLAQERRAAERKKQERNAILKKVLLAALVVIIFGGVIIYGAMDSKKQKESGDISDTNTTNEATDDLTSTDGLENSQPELNTDTSLEVAEGDVVNIDYVGSIDGFNFEGGTGNYDLEIGSHSFIDDFEDQLVGHKVGEKVDVYATFPEGYGRSYQDANGESQSFDGKEALFEVTINGIYK